jgi:hypothetical protein
MGVKKIAACLVEDYYDPKVRLVDWLNVAVSSLPGDLQNG